MKPFIAAALVLASAAGLSCSDETPEAPETGSRLEVFVHWDGVGLADKRLEVLELGIERATDATGIAEFVLPPGTYTLRAYEINRGGPATGFVDTTVKTTRGETTRVEVVDCLPCVAATRDIVRTGRSTWTTSASPRYARRWA